MNPTFPQHMSSQGQQPQVPQPPALFNNQPPQQQGQQQQQQQKQQQQRGPPMIGMNINMNVPQAAQQQTRQSPTTNASPSQATFAGTRHPPYQPPSTPVEAARERERVALLLEINSLLLQHASTLQSNNQGGVMPQPGQPAADKHPTPEYVSYLRAIQANIAFCATVETKGKQQNRGGQTLPGPAIMEAPNSASEELLKLYEKLREIFPGWRGVMKSSMMPGAQGGPGQQQGPAQAQAQMQAMQQQRQQQMGQQAQGQMQGMGGPMGQGQGQGQQQQQQQQQQQGGMPFGNQMPMGMMSMQMGQLSGQQQNQGGQNQQWMAGQAG